MKDDHYEDYKSDDHVKFIDGNNKKKSYITRKGTNGCMNERGSKHRLKIRHLI